MVRLNTGGVTHHQLLHRLVAIAFIPRDPNRPDRDEVNHKDYDRTNCLPDNLEWVTRVENIRHGMEGPNYKPSRGERSGMSRLRDHEVISIRERVSRGEQQKALAVFYGVTQKQISVIVARKQWAHL
jgi:hypothetical protein